jgi:hypothetical protein
VLFVFFHGLLVRGFDLPKTLFFQGGIHARTLMLWFVVLITRLRKGPERSRLWANESETFRGRWGVYNGFYAGGEGSVVVG